MILLLGVPIAIDTGQFAYFFEQGQRECETAANALHILALKT